MLLKEQKKKISNKYYACYFIISVISSIIIPDITPKEYSNDTILRFSLIFLLFLNSTNREAPLLVNNPPINAPIDMELFIYNSVNITLDAQFGINPIKLVINVPNMVFVKNIFDR